MQEQALQTAVLDKLYTPYLQGEKPNIAAFAETFLGQDADIEHALAQLHTARNFLGIFIGESAPGEGQQNIDDVESAIAVHMRALCAEKPNGSQELVSEVDRVFGNEATRQAAEVIDEKEWTYPEDEKKAGLYHYEQDREPV